MTDEQIIQKAREAGMTGEATPAVIEFVRNLLEAEIEACANTARLALQHIHKVGEIAESAIRARKSI